MSNINKLFLRANSCISTRCLLISAVFALASCGGGSEPTSVATDPAATLPSATVPPTFYLKSEMSEIGIADSSPNTVARGILDIQVLCNTTNQLEGRPTSPPPEPAGLNRIGLATYEYWSLNGKIKELRTTQKLDIDKTTCAATRSTELIAWLGDATSHNIVNYDRQTVQYVPSPAFKPNTTVRQGLGTRTIAGELCTNVAVPLTDVYCVWNRLANWKIGLAVGTALTLTLNITYTFDALKLKIVAIQIDLAPAIAPNTFDIPANFKKS